MGFFKLFVLITAALFQLEVVSGQSLSSVLEYRNSYGFRVKRNQVEQFSNIALCKENDKSVAFMGTKIVDSKFTKLVTINLLNGKMKHRPILLPDSIVTEILENNDAVQAIATNGSILAMALIQNVLIFKLDEAKKNFNSLNPIRCLRCAARFKCRERNWLCLVPIPNLQRRLETITSQQLI